MTNLVIPHELMPTLTTAELDDICHGPSRVWKFALTMPKVPHWYLLRDASNNDLFCRFVLHIRRHGYQGHFYRTPRTYFAWREFKYWTADLPLLALDNPRLNGRGTTLVNRDLRELTYS